MITKDVLEETENMIYKYYENIRLKDRLRFKSERLEMRRKLINDDLRKTNIKFTERGIRAIDYSKEKTQSSLLGESSIERYMIKEVTKLENELEETIKKNLEIEVRIRELDESISDIEYIMNKLDEEHKEYIKYRYSKKYNYEKIAMVLPMSPATARRRRKQIIEIISNWIKN